jgi:hypothetical protein
LPSTRVVESQQMPVRFNHPILAARDKAVAERFGLR